jgi:hypothetical protein
MKLRRHRGGYEESMETTIEIEPTKTALLKAIQDSALIGLPTDLTEDHLSVSQAGMDQRNGWDTYLVTIEGWGVYGYTDGPLKEEVASIAKLSIEEAMGKRPEYAKRVIESFRTPTCGCSNEKEHVKRHFIGMGCEVPFATSPFDEEMRPPEIARDQTVMHQTVNGKGAVGRIK